MSQQALELETRHGYSFADYLARANLQTVELLKAFITTANGQCIFLWGNSGLGKTHLLHATCQLAATNGLSSHYIPLKQWKEKSSAILTGLEQSDLVCIDDIDQVSACREWEIALFHLFNEMIERSQRLVFSAYNTPDAIKIDLADLRSRLASGIILHLQDHDDESKRQVLQYRARQLGIRLPDSVSQYLLSRYNRDLSELWILLDKLDRETLSNHRQLTVPFVKQILE